MLFDLRDRQSTIFFFFKLLTVDPSNYVSIRSSTIYSLRFSSLHFFLIRVSNSAMHGGACRFGFSQAPERGEEWMRLFRRQKNEEGCVSFRQQRDARTEGGVMIRLRNGGAWCISEQMYSLE